MVRCVCESPTTSEMCAGCCVYAPCPLLCCVLRRSAQSSFCCPCGDMLLFCAGVCARCYWSSMHSRRRFEGTAIPFSFGIATDAVPAGGRRA